MILTRNGPSRRAFGQERGCLQQAEDYGGRNVMTGDGTREVAWNLQTGESDARRKTEGSKTYEVV